jgi:hypothetical protein
MTHSTATTRIPTAGPDKMRVRFEDDPVSDVYFVNRIAENLITTMFYQPEDFDRFRYERDVELMEKKGGRRQPPRCSMDLTRSNLSVPPAPHVVDHLRVKIQRPASSPVRSSVREQTLSPLQNPGGRELSPLRPCSSGRPSASPQLRGGKRPMALAA